MVVAVQLALGPQKVYSQPVVAIFAQEVLPPVRVVPAEAVMRLDIAFGRIS